jgi:small subunit ribosomal protein S20
VKKDVIRSRRLRVRNLNVRSEVKTMIRKARVAIQGADTGAAGESVKVANRLLDKAATKGIIHKRQAARRKSRLARRLAKKPTP